MKEIEKFVNTRYRVLRYLIDNKDRLNIVRCTQDEMGTALSLSRGTINRILNELKNDDFGIVTCDNYDEFKKAMYGIAVNYLKEMESDGIIKQGTIDKALSETDDGILI